MLLESFSIYFLVMLVGSAKMFIIIFGKRVPLIVQCVPKFLSWRAKCQPFQPLALTGKVHGLLQRFQLQSHSQTWNSCVIGSFFHFDNFLSGKKAEEIKEIVIAGVKFQVNLRSA